MEKFLKKSYKYLIVFSFLISIFCLSAFAVQISSNGTVFTVTYADYNTNNGLVIADIQEFSSGSTSGFRTTISNSYSGVSFTRVKFNFFDGSNTNGTFKITISTSGVAFENGSYISTVRDNISNGDTITFGNVEKNNYVYNYTGEFPSEFFITSSFIDLNTSDLYSTIYYDIEFVPYYTTPSVGGNSVDNITNDYINQEQELNTQLEGGQQSAIDMFSGLSNNVTGSTLSGLAVISTIMTKFLGIGKIGNLTNIALTLGIFAFVIGSAIGLGSAIMRNNRRGGK